MGKREELREEMMDLIIPIFEEITGLCGGVEGTTPVFVKNQEKLFNAVKISCRLDDGFCYGLETINDFAYHFMKLVYQKEIADFITSITVCNHGWDEPVYAELIPEPVADESKLCKEERDQRLRKVMNYELKLGNLKTAIRNHYNYFEFTEEFYYARTLRQLVQVIAERYYAG